MKKTLPVFFLISIQTCFSAEQRQSRNWLARLLCCGPQRHQHNSVVTVEGSQSVYSDAELQGISAIIDKRKGLEAFDRVLDDNVKALEKTLRNAGNDRIIANYYCSKEEALAAQINHQNMIAGDRPKVAQGHKSSSGYLTLNMMQASKASGKKSSRYTDL